MLFICSGNAAGGISVIVKNQGESLGNAGVDISYFTIDGRGLWSYLKHIPLLRKRISTGSYDLFHAHYYLSAIVASLARCRPLVVSLMGSDTRIGFPGRLVMKMLSSVLWRAVVVKSVSMKENVGLKGALVIPNGVDIEKVKPEVSSSCENGPKTILFVADPARPSKNFELARQAVDVIKSNGVRLKVIHSAPHDEVISEMNRSDVVLLTSKWEGSPNIVKEAMACNVPVVSTDVGDVRWLFGDTPGYYITTFDPKDVACKIETALKYGKPTTGRDRILTLGLDSQTIATRIKEIYDSMIQ